MDQGNSTLLNKLTVLWVIFFTMDALCNGMVLALTNTDWSTLSGTKKVVVTAMIIKTWTGAMIALFTQTASRLEKGKPIIPISDSTQQWTKSDLTTPSTAVQTPPA